MEDAFQITRRLVLTASAGLMLPRWVWAETRSRLALCWRLEETGDSALESVGATMDAIASRTGHAVWVGKGSDRALRLDGYSVWVEQDAAVLPLASGKVTVCAWVALESFPVNDAAVIYISSKGEHISSKSDAEAVLSIDRLGFLQFRVQQGSSSSVYRSPQSLRKARWTHLAASFGEAGIAVCCNGVQCGKAQDFRGRLELGKDVVVTVGKSPQCSVTAGVFPTGVFEWIAAGRQGLRWRAFAERDCGDGEGLAACRAS